MRPRSFSVISVLTEPGAVFSLPLWVPTSLGVVTFLLSGALHQRYQWRQLLHRERHLPALFPSQPRP